MVFPSFCLPDNDIQDKANQLVSSKTADGKVTKYEYDAAGRMTKEGEKTFAYGWLDKVMQVAENGKTTQSYSYDISGQLATADYGDSRETFLWDGLALLSRNNLKYVNEPAVTGGNPILAGDKMLFDDMLGNTLGVKDGEKFSAIDRDAFGELKPGEKPNLAVNFFTGKPEVDGLGYSFLFRNYRADLGKWQTTDPLGYPDGWNNLAYCNNQAFLTDPLGLSSFDDYDLSQLSSKDYGFVKHFYTGDGASVTLSQMGVFSAIKKEIDKQGILDRFKKQTDDVARGMAERFDYNGPFSNSFNNSYNFNDASYSIGSAVLSGAFSGNMTTYLLDDGKKMYSWSGTVTLTFSDEFTDPLSIIEHTYGSSTSPNAPDWLVSIANLGGDGFHVGEVWEVTMSGGGIIE